MAWSAISLNDVADIFNGKTPSKADQRATGHPVLKIRDVSSLGRFRDGFESFVDESYVAKHREKALRLGDTLILNAAHNASHVASKTYFAEPAPIGALITGEWLIIRPRGDRVDPRYVNHWVNSTRTRAELRELVNGIHLYPKDVGRLRLELPPIEEQRRIANILDHTNALRVKRREALALLDDLSQSIFLDKFGDPTSNERGWDDGLQLDAVADVSSGITKGRKLPPGTPTLEVPYMAVANVQDRRLNLGLVKTIDVSADELARYRLQAEDLLLTEGGDPDKLGRGTLWRDELPLSIHQNHIFRVRLRDARIRPLFLNWLIGSERGKRYFLRSAKQTTGIASINMTQLRAFPLLVPPVDVQAEFERQLAAAKSTLDQAAAHAIDLDEMFLALQQRALAGLL